MLALPPPDGLEPEVVSGFSITEKHIEQAGEHFERFALKKLGLMEESSSEDEQMMENILGAEQFDKEKLNQKRKKPTQDQMMSKMFFKDHYDALGLGGLSFSATEADIRKSYKTKVLLHHPDKFEEGEYDEGAKMQWLAIQDAYEVLIDADKRRKYDSSIEFDDSIPDQKEYEEEEFLKVFGAVFKRNAYFSEKKPVPDLGDSKTPIKKILKFYIFWESFKSWRDFVVEGEFDLEQAENRYERRYMERENKRMKKSLFKKEKQRIANLVTRAKESDIRLTRHRKAEEAEIERVREEKRLEKQRRKDEEERVKREALEKKKEKLLQEQMEVKRKDDAIKAQRMEKQNKIVDAKKGIISKVNLPEYNELFLDVFLPGVKEEEMVELSGILEEDGSQEKLRDEFKEFVARIKNRQSNPQGNKSNKTGGTSKKKEMLMKWSTEEMIKLQKALVKYPAGLSGRWEKISDYLENAKTPIEVNQMAKELAVKNIKSEKDLVDTIEGAKRKLVAMESEWTQEQQKALEKAIKEFPASMDKRERWVKIANAVEGKTAKE